MPIQIQKSAKNSHFGALSHCHSKMNYILKKFSLILLDEIFTGISHTIFIFYDISIKISKGVSYLFKHSEYAI